MALLHRLTAPNYLGGLPGTHDFLNDPAANGDAGMPAPADAGKKASGPNEGTYFIAFGEDATSYNANRPNLAHGESIDFLDDVVSGEVPVVDEVAGNSGMGLSSLALAGEVFVGKQGTMNTQFERDQLFKVLDANTGNEVIDSAGATVKVSLVHDGAMNSVVGVPASGFETAPTIDFAPAIPAGTDYRIVFGRRSKLSDVVRTKTHLHAFVRWAIAGSHQTAGEVLKFMNQAARFVAGDVAALTATVIETPGIGGNVLPEANSLTIDVDPADTFAGSGSFDVRFNRDTANARTPFRVDEGTGPGTSNIQNPEERLAFSDLHVLNSGFTKTWADLSSADATQGDQALRLVEKDPGAEPLSLLKAVNARLLTCGDGSVSFGDFNGATALQDALAFVAANAIGGAVRIILKRGTYSVDNFSAFDVGSSTELILEGEACTITIIRNDAMGMMPGLRFTGNQRVTLRNLGFEMNGGSPVACYFDGSFVVIENCIFFEQGIAYANSGTLRMQALLMRGSSFEHAHPNGFPCVLLTSNNGGTIDARGIVFEDCYLRTSDDAALRIENTGGAAAGSHYRGILFNRCRFALGSSTVMGGNLVANTGVFALTPGMNNNITVQDIEFRDCDVTAANSANANILLYLRTSNGANHIRVGTLTISGGEWRIPAASLILPFYIGGSTYNSSSNVTAVVIRDVRWGYDVGAAVAYGVPTTEVSAPNATSFGCFFINARHLTMKNVRWISASTRGGAPDFYAMRVRSWDIDGVHIAETWFDAGAAMPDFRVRLESDATPNPNPSGTVRGFVLDGGASAPMGGTGHYGFSLVPNRHLQLIGCGVHRLSGIDRGMTVPNTTTLGGATGLTLRDCFVRGVAGHGIYYEHDGAAGSRELERLRIDGCTITSNGGRGIYLHGAAGMNADPFKGVTVVNCHIEGNAGVGLFLAPGAGTDGGYENQLVVCSNIVRNNNGGLTNTQIQYGKAGSADGWVLSGTIYGNDCGNNGAAFGKISFYNASTMNRPVHTRGAETGYNDGNNTVGGRSFIEGNAMIHNLAKLDYN